MAGRRPGAGIRHGAWCLGCCWALMAALFAVGVMSLGWMALIAAFIAGEKLLPWPNAARWTVAVLLLALGIGVAFFPVGRAGLRRAQRRDARRRGRARRRHADDALSRARSCPGVPRAGEAAWKRQTAAERSSYVRPIARLADLSDRRHQMAASARALQADERADANTDTSRTYPVADLLLQSAHGPAVIEVAFDNGGIGSEKVTGIYELRPDDVPKLPARDREQLASAFVERGGIPADKDALRQGTAQIRQPAAPRLVVTAPARAKPTPELRAARNELRCVQRARGDVTKLLECAAKRDSHMRHIARGAG